MECLHGKPASATTTKNGLFWYCGCKPSCQFFCPQKDRNIFERAVATFQASACPQPVCHDHQKLPKMRVVNDNAEENVGDPSLCVHTEIIRARFGKGEMLSRVLNRYMSHGLTSRVRKFKKDGPNQNRLFYCCPNDKENPCGFFEWKPQEYLPVVEDVGCLFTHPLQYQYQDKDTGKAMTSPVPDSNEAYGEFLFNQTANPMA